MKAIKLAAIVVVVSTLSAIGSTTVAQVFHDDFNGSTIDLSKWNLDVGGGSVVVQDGRATLSAPCGAQFPYLTAAHNPFPAVGDFLIRVGFRYVSVQWGGNGFGAAYLQRGFGAWQDACCGGLRVAIGDLYPVFVSTSADTDPHVFEWQYVAGFWSMYLDGNLVGRNASDFRPSTLFFGHPPYSYCPWTTQEIDFVHVEPLATVPVTTSTWGMVRLIYR